MKNMNVLGFSLKDYSVKEAMKMVKEYLKTAKVDTISFLSMDHLLEASAENDYKKYIESTDLLVPISKEILVAASIESRHRVHEVEENRFVKEFSELISKEKCTVFILGDGEEAVENFKSYLAETAKGVKVVGSFVFCEDTNDDRVVNEINFAFPDVVISIVPWRRQERFVYENKGNINARLFVSVDKLIEDRNTCGGIKKILDNFQRIVFKRRVIKYENKQ